ncbi:MAG: hypothetical protein U5N56_02810 [Candidatus Marinimicrobia bacterium]|nr:hypothetical protein [Candidatus Neomarinimicrobiota bacterium]
MLSINFDSEEDSKDRGLMPAKDEKIKEIFNRKRIGYSYKEIATKLKTSAHYVREKMKELGRQFIEYFDLPDTYLLRFGLT